MEAGTVNIKLRADGVDKTTRGIGKVSGSISDLRKSAGALAGSLGGIGGSIARLLAGVFTGGLWEIGARAISTAISLWNKWRDSAKEAAEEAAMAQEAAAVRQQKALEKLAEVQRKVAAGRQAAIADGTKLWQAERDAVNDLAKAMLELERANARLAGDTAGADKASGELAALESQARRQALVRNLFDARRRLDAANDSQRQAERRAATAGEQAKSATGGRFAASQLKQRERQRDASLKIRDEALDDAEKARKAARDAQRDIENAKKALEAFDIREKAKLADEAAQAAEAGKKAAEERQKADAKAAEDRQKAEIAAAQAAAQERARLEQEAHQKRMADLREEIAAQKERAAALSARAASAASEFDRAFAMYRDPSRAAAEIGEEKDYRSDLDRLHKDARRYGGKWRIDELSSLMAAGDTQGVSDTLASWRKSKGFTPEVEAMVRASAAEQTKTTVEDELRKIENNTAGLSEAMRQMADAVGTQKPDLSAINSNTANLANKVDELLSIKG